MIGPYVLKRVLGQGSASVVRQAEHKETREQVAIKIIGKGKDPTKRRKAIKAAREISILRAISHPNVVKLFHTYESRTHFFLVMELVKGMELFDYLINKGRLNTNEALVIFSQVVKGLMACHERGVVHRDLKAENILLDTQGNVKIVDFELANFVRSEPLRTFCGSSYYAPPEICAGKVYDGEKADVWSMGVLLFMMVVGEYPFDDENDAELIRKILKKPVSYPPAFDAQMRDLIDKLLTKDPKQRLSVQRIPHQPCFFVDGKNMYFEIEAPPSPSTNSDRRVQVLENLVLELERQLLPEVQTSLANLDLSSKLDAPTDTTIASVSTTAASIATHGKAASPPHPLGDLAKNPDWQHVSHSGSGNSINSSKSRSDERRGGTKAAGQGNRNVDMEKDETSGVNSAKRMGKIQATMGDDPLWWIMYRSQLEIKANEDPIEMIKKIARDSLHKNRSLGIGGMLYCDRKTGRIIQILEGRRSVLKQLCAAIMMDTRHTRFMIIKNEQVPRRKFKDWGMSFANTLSSFQRNRMSKTPLRSDEKKVENEATASELSTTSEDQPTQSGRMSKRSKT
eukprot:CAMPEP_0114523648 /NCGR_PEP_ID=MMETSP0109-20121206/21408_1 /TAXON_ID=29199 /ORGANISM="Chlorarachnion reptans, Strain CCCM449" /LENGTH=567 /DNA_ID=CAMNT_0001704987 /DNA_START=129 /DNA_END=1832 /DNA_ORIENTATION=+